MKKFAVLLLLLPVPMLAQTVDLTRQVTVKNYTVFTLPPHKGGGHAALVIDGANFMDCTVGGGTYKVWCWDSGVTWFPIGSNTGGLSTLFPGPVSLPSDGTRAPYLEFAGNTVSATVSANKFQLVGPPSSTFTAYGLQFSITAPAVGQSFRCDAPDPTTHVAQCSFYSLNSMLAVSDIAPVASHSGLIMVANPKTAIHVTRVWCAVQGSTNVVVNLDKRSEATLGSDSGNHLLGVDLTAVSAGASTSTFSNVPCGGTTSCAVAAHTPVVMTFTSVSGAPTALNCSLDYTVD